MAYKFKKSNCETEIDVDVDVCKCCEDKEKENLFLQKQKIKCDIIDAIPEGGQGTYIMSIIDCIYQQIMDGYETCEELVGARSIFDLISAENIITKLQKMVEDYNDKYGTSYSVDICLK